MYKILLSIFMPFVLFSLEIDKKYKVIVLKDWKPYYYLNKNNQADGYAVEIFELIAKESNINYEYIIVENWLEGLSLIKEGKADIIPNIGISKDRAKYLLFSQSTDTLSINLYKRNNSFSIKSNKDIKKRSIGIVKSNICEKLITREIVPNIKKYKDFSVTIDALLSGEVDSICYPNILMDVRLKELNLSKQIVSFGDSLYEIKRGLGISKDEFELLPIINKAISKLKMNGEYNRVYSKWFSLNKKIEFTRDELIFISFLITISFLIVIFYIFYFTNKKRWILTRHDLENEILEKTKDLHKLSITDKLTGVYNRSKLDEVIQEKIEISKRTKEEFFVVMIDIDYFKNVNDEYGHLAGDIALVEFSNIIKSNIRIIDTFGRWGGEEFLIISSHDSMKILFEVQRIKECINQHVFKTIGKKTASFGISSYENNDTLESIVKRADIALYEAKKNGRNQIVVK